MSLTYQQLRLQLAETLEPYTDAPTAWVDRHGEAMRRLAHENGARRLVAAVRAAAAAGPRKLDFFEQDAARWLQQAEQEQRQAPPPAREPQPCKACGAPVVLTWCRECGCEVSATPEEIDECRREWRLAVSDPEGARAAREQTLAAFRADAAVGEKRERRVSHWQFFQ